MLAITPLVLPAATQLMLALAGAGIFAGAFLSPGDHRRRQHNH